MSDVTKAISLLDEIASPRGARESYKAVVNRVADYTNRIAASLNIIEEPISPSRLDDIWRGEAKFVRGYELDSLRAARDTKILGNAINEHRTILDRLAAVEAALRLQDEDFHGESIDGLREMHRGVDSSMDHKVRK